MREWCIVAPVPIVVVRWGKVWGRPPNVPETGVRKMRARLAVLPAALAVILSCSGCQAAGVEPDGDRAAVVPAELMARAKQDGWVRVIVNLRVPSGSTEAIIRAARE